MTEPRTARATRRTPHRLRAIAGLLIALGPAATALAQPLPGSAEEAAPAASATLPFSERPTRFDSKEWILYGWRLRARSEIRSILTDDLAEPSDQTEAFLRARAIADTELAPNLDAYIDGRLNLRWRRSRSGNRSLLVDGELSEAWLKWRRPFSLPVGFVQGGRMKFKEERGFWWDEEIESLRLGLDTSLWKGQLGVGARLSQDEIDDDGRRELRDDFVWILFELRHQWSFENFLELRVLHQFDEDQTNLGKRTRRFASNEELTWIGGRITGRTPGTRWHRRVHYWLEAVGVTGDETQLDRDATGVVVNERDRSVGEWAIDAGATLETRLPGTLAFSAAFATASKRFRQPSLFRNRMTFAGDTPLRRYGEVLRPNLGNLHVVTAAVGGAPLPGVWLQFAYHHYWQVEERPFLVDDALVQEPFGRDRDLGDAIDASLGIDFLERWRLEGVYGVLISGDGYGTRANETAQRASLLLRRRFP